MRKSERDDSTSHVWRVQVDGPSAVLEGLDPNGVVLEYEDEKGSVSVTTASTTPLETIELSDEEASVASPRPATCDDAEEVHPKIPGSTDPSVSEEEEMAREASGLKLGSQQQIRALPRLDDNRADQATEGQIWVRNALCPWRKADDRTKLQEDT